MPQVSGTFPQLTEARMKRKVSAKQARRYGAVQAHGKGVSAVGKAPARPVPGGLRAHRAMARGLAHGGKVSQVMHEFREGELHSGSSKGPRVTSRKQAIAIALSEARRHGR